MGTETEAFKGKKNIYCCHACGNHIVTVDVDAGVTPFMIACVSPGCEGHMQSSMYRVFDQAMKASYEWYKPTEAELATKSASVQAHCRMGGLLQRPAAV